MMGNHLEHYKKLLNDAAAEFKWHSEAKKWYITRKLECVNKILQFYTNVHML